MFAVKLKANNYVSGFQTANYKEYLDKYAKIEGYIFVSRPSFWSDNEVGQFLKNPWAYYLDSQGVFRRNYNL